MSTLTDEILTTFFKNNRDGTEMIPDSVIISACKTAGYEASEAEDKLKTLVETHRLSEAGDHYGISRINSLSLKTHRGTDSTPWQFSLVRTADEIMITHAKAGPEKFDPVLKRFTIEDQPIDNDDDDDVEFHHAVSRRIWQENPDQPVVRSQRSNGRIFELLCRDPDGWHLTRAEPTDNSDDSAGSVEYKPTEHPGVTVSATYLRSEDDTEVKYIEKRHYRITEEILQHYAEPYVLSYYELNEESHERGALWKIDDAVAHRLLRH